MATNKVPSSPESGVTAARARSFLFYGFAISIVLHFLILPWVHLEQTHAEEDQPQKVTVVRVPTPPPTPPPTPTPKPTLPPTPPPKATPPPQQTPAPQQPKLKINTAKTVSKSNTGPTEHINQNLTGVTQGIPQGVGTGPPSTAPPATPAPATPKPTPTPQSCPRPNVPATTIHAVEPDTPAMAQQQGIQGTVQVIVSLDQNSHVTATRVQSSPSAILNSAALSAARQSTFQTEVRDCKPIAADYIFSVDFTSQ